MILGEMRLFAFNFVPRNWAMCNGQFLPINQNQALFSLLGTTYGGNGQTSFALPDLRGRAPRHTSDTVWLGERAGSPTHTLAAHELPAHTHAIAASGAVATATSPVDRLPAVGRDDNYARPGGPTVAMQAGRVTQAGSSMPHENRQPFTCMTWGIALQGHYPSQIYTMFDDEPPYLGELRIFGGNFAPVGWAFCDGGLLPINEHDLLFNLLGTTYGGDGQDTFAVPDLRGRIPVHIGGGYVVGEMGGVEHVTLASSHMPQHTHELVGAAGNGADKSPQGNRPAHARRETYAPAGSESMGPAFTSSAVGGSQAHDNMGPSLAMNWIIATQGVWPQQ